MAEKKKAGKAMSYRGKPLARCGNVLYLGNLSASHFVMMQVIQTEKLEDLCVPQKVAVQLIANDPQLPPKDRVVKRAMKDGLYSAMIIGSVWLDQYQS